MDTKLLLERITELCDKKGISKNKAFIESGVGKNFISNLQTSNPSMGKITMLANYFNVSVNYLLGNTSTEEDHLLLSEHEKAIIKAYRAAKPSMQEAIDKLLEIDEKTLMREILSNTEVISITTKSKSKTKV